MRGDEGGRSAMSRTAAVFAVVAAAAVAAALLSPPGLLALAAAAAEVVAPPDGCTRRCGDISIPYPFGVEPGCYLEPGFNLTCDDRSARRPRRLFLGDGTVQVLEISIANGTVRINGSYVDFSDSPAGTPTTGVTAAANGTWNGALGEGGPYTLAPMRNRLMAMGCDVRAVLLGDHNQTVSSCSTFCNHLFTGAMLGSADCSGANCCQAKILLERSSYGFQAFQMNGDPSFDFTRLYVVEAELSTDPDLISNEMRTLPAVLNWRINHTTCHGNASSPACRSSNSFCENRTLTRLDSFDEEAGHVCRCAVGYQGNPYVTDGCVDIDECQFSDRLIQCYGVCINMIGGYRCKCPPGFSGNAYIPNGCQDINECAHPDIYRCNGICTNQIGTFHCQCNKGTYWDPFTNRGCIAIKSSSSSDLKIGLLVGGGTSFLLLAIGTPVVTRKIKRHKLKKLKERFFKQNHGLLLQQLISQRSDIGGRMIITL